MFAAGAAGVTQGWPFACYPDFARPVGPWMPTVELVAVHADGAEEVIDERLLAEPARSQRFYAEAWVIAGHYGPVDPATRRAWLERLARRPKVAAAAEGAARLRLHRAERAVDPDAPATRRGALLVTPALDIERE